MKLRFGDTVVDALPAAAADFGPHHDEQLRAARFAAGELSFPDRRWLCRYLGKGEEKAAYVVCDHNRRVFAVELIDENGYLNGRFAGGTYFFQRRLPNLTGVAFDAEALAGLRFTGLVKVREFAHGYEWARFQWRHDRTGWADHLLTAWLRAFLGGRFAGYTRRFRDVHERNVVFEVRGWRRRGVPVLARDAAGRVRLVRVRLRPIDVR
ncbi:MAG TPA: hypothetical protein VF062_27980 [Candidatus Limnocylindrales bacterium]